jgi:O-antigen ligase
MLTANSAITSGSAEEASAAIPEGAELAFGFLWLFTFVLYARPEDIVPAVGAFHMTFVFGICAGLAYFGALVSGRARLLRSPELLIVLLLTAWFMLGIPFAYWRGGSFNLLTGVWFKTLFGFFLLTQILTTVGRIRQLLWAIIFSQLVATGASILLQGNGASQIGGRATGINQAMFGWNFLGITASVTLPYIAALYISRRSVLRTGALLLTVALTMWLLILTASRGGFLGVILSIALTWLVVLRGSRRGRFVGIVVAICLVIALAKAPDVFWGRLQTVWGGSGSSVNATTESAEESTRSREFMLQQSIKYTLQNPIVGLGIGNFADYNDHLLQRPEEDFGTHNTYTQISSEAGIPALVLFLWLLQMIFLHSKKTARQFANDPENAELHLLARATLVSMASFAFGGLFAHIGYEYLLYYLAGISAGFWTITRENAKLPLRPPEAFATIPRWSTKSC